MRVLIADDSRDAADTLAILLRRWGHEVRVAYDGLSALAVARHFKPHVALLDVQMPGRSGLDLTRAIRASTELSATHVILLTSKAQAADIEAGLAAGANAYLTKPFSPRELLARIRASSTSTAARSFGPAPCD